MMIEAAASNADLEEREDFRTLWAISAEDIRFFKVQQYSVTNYALAVYAALGAIKSIAQGTTVPLALILILMAALSAVGAVYQLHALQTSLHKSRRFGGLGRDNLSPRMNRLIVEARESEHSTKRVPPGDVLGMLDLVVIGGFVLTAWFLLT